jgi:VacB/RNase II family 3'-5' exoribonuclease
MATHGTVNLRAIAQRMMQERGFLTEFPSQALQEAERAHEPLFDKLGYRDLSGWLWSSIDNDESRDLDQIEFARQEGDSTRLFVAIAQVDRFAPRDSALDRAAQHNTTSIYTGVEMFPMLPERLSTNLSSLVEGQKRTAVVFEMKVTSDGKVTESAVYSAIVTNHAQLTYDAAAAWLERGGNPASLSEISQRRLEAIKSNPALQEQLALQDAAAQTLRQRRHEMGALTLQAIEFRPTFTPSGEIQLGAHVMNRATQLIEDFMIAANQAAVQFLLAHQSPTLRRVVRTPKRWDRIMELAAIRGDPLPEQPDSEKLEAFLCRQQKKDPNRFPDLSLAVIKLLGRGEYVVNLPGQRAQGHFSLAVDTYSHSTAPNRRYPDILTQRLLLAAIQGLPAPYSPHELELLAARCTEKEDDANKVERSVRKSIAAVALARHVGEEFTGYVTGATDKGTWVRIANPPVEGKLVGKPPRLDVGDRVQVRLVDTSPEHGYIDFEFVKRDAVDGNLEKEMLNR